MDVIFSSFSATSLLIRWRSYIKRSYAEQFRVALKRGLVEHLLEELELAAAQLVAGPRRYGRGMGRFLLAVGHYWAVLTLMIKVSFIFSVGAGCFKVKIIN